MKQCSKCEVQKAETDFSFRSKTSGIRLGVCRDCHRTYAGVHYAKHRDYYIAKAKETKAKAYSRNQQTMIEYLRAHPCIDCGESDPVVLEFDHVRGVKTESVSYLAFSLLVSKRRLLEEIEKCDVRCANCHRRKTAKQLGWRSLSASGIGQGPTGQC